jgi:hypothetical protein
MDELEANRRQGRPRSRWNNIKKQILVKECEQKLFLLVKTLRVEGVTWSAQRIPTAVNFGFLDQSRYFFIQVAPQLP